MLKHRRRVSKQTLLDLRSRLDPRCAGPSTFLEVQFSNSLVYLLHICIVFPILSLFVLAQKKNREGLYVGEGFEDRNTQSSQMIELCNMVK